MAIAAAVKNTPKIVRDRSERGLSLVSKAHRMDISDIPLEKM
jgi:hypothetical protein